MLTHALEEVAAALAALDIKGTHDPRRLPVPGVLLYPAGIDFDRLDRNVATVDVEFILVAKGLGTPKALEQLEQMLDKVRQAWPVGQVTAVNVNLPNHSPDPLPGFSFTLPFEITQE